QGRALASTVAARGWTVFQAGDVMDALGMVVDYLPDVVVIDLATRPILGTETFYHLRSMTGTPVPTLLLVDDDDVDKAPPYEWLEVPPASAGNQPVIRVIEAMTG